MQPPANFRVEIRDRYSKQNRSESRHVPSDDHPREHTMGQQKVFSCWQKVFGSKRVFWTRPWLPRSVREEET
jgi:hypothetical protein